MEKNITKKYANGEITIVWKPASCIHSTICWRKATGLPQVFNPNERPWIKPEGSDTDTIIEQVKKCPGGALSYYYNNDAVTEQVEVLTDRQVEVMPNDAGYFLLSLAQVSFKVTVLLNTRFPGDECLSGVK